MDRYKKSTASHGGELKDTDKNIKYDFSVNINPLGLPEGVKTALLEKSGIYTDYPDPYCIQLRDALAEKEGVRPEQIVCGSGASDIIYRICGALDIKRALIPVPAFSEYERALRLNGADAEYIYTSPDDGFALTDELFEKWAREQAAHAWRDIPDAVFLCDPTNPSGRLLDPGLVAGVYDWCRQNGALLIADECFLEFHEKRNDITLLNIIRNNNKKIYSENIKNEINNAEIRKTDGAPARLKGSRGHSGIIVINAFTKIYSMAGLRLGYAVCSHEETASRLSRYAPHWNVSGPAQAAGAAAIREKAYLEKTVRYIKKERMRLSAELSSALAEKNSSFKIFESDANYILFTAPAGLAEHMADEGIAIRDCGNYKGLAEMTEHFYRVAVRSENEDDIMLETLRRCLRWL